MEVKKIIASDIDGTLIPYGEKTFDPKLYSLIRDMRREGLLFVTASGRTKDSLEELFRPVKNEISYLSENGGAIWNGSTKISETPIPRPLLEELTSYLYESPGLICYITSPYKKYVYTDKKEDFDFLKSLFPDLIWITSLDQLEDNPVKVTGFTKGDIEEYLPYLNERFEGRINIMRAGPDVVDFGIANKGYGLKILTEFYNLTPDDVYSFGDNYNDKSMLEYAANSYVMRTDDPVLLNSAKNVCDNVIEEIEKIYEKSKSPDAEN